MMIKHVNKGLYICIVVGIVDAVAASFLLGVKKGDNDCLKNIAEKNDSLNF